MIHKVCLVDNFDPREVEGLNNGKYTRSTWNVFTNAVTIKV